LLSAQPGLTAEQQTHALEAGAVDLGPPGGDPVFGAGRISAPGALQALSKSRRPVAQ
jgi:hypothetical protein